MPARAASSPKPASRSPAPRRSARGASSKGSSPAPARVSPPKTRRSSRGGATPTAKATKKAPPSTDLVAWQSRAQKRPNYFSDDDTRPTYRGSAYAWVRRTGVAWAVLTAYSVYALIHARDNWRPALLACRAVHVAVLLLNVVLSDSLHNLDLRLGRAYRQPSTVALEQRIHAYDWVAALAIPASYHVLFILGVMDFAMVEREDALLLVANLAALAVMCARISPARITPRRELFLAYVATFGVQMVLLLAAFYRRRAEHPGWLPLWGVYACGLVAKGLEVPNNDVFGHHEILHLSVIVGNAIGLVIDVMTT